MAASVMANPAQPGEFQRRFMRTLSVARLSNAAPADLAESFQLQERIEPFCSSTQRSLLLQPCARRLYRAPIARAYLRHPRMLPPCRTYLPTRGGLLRFGAQCAARGLDPPEDPRACENPLARTRKADAASSESRSARRRISVLLQVSPLPPYARSLRNSSTCKCPRAGRVILRGPERLAA